MTSDRAADHTPEETEAGQQQAVQPEPAQPESAQPESAQAESAQPESAQAESAQDATKRRFREALEAKQGRQGTDHVTTDPHGTDHGHGPVDAKRVFRRKTG